MRWAVYLALLAFPGLTAFAQPPSGSAHFDVISIKRSISGAGPPLTPPLQHGRLRFTNVTVKDVLTIAFDPVGFYHIKGGPDWIAVSSAARFDIEATTEERVVTEERYHQMLRAMLADRFQLRFHEETNQEPVYALVPDRKGMKLKATDPSSCVPYSPDVTLTPNGTTCGRQYGLQGTHFEGIGMTTTTLARYLSLLAGRIVVDRTGYKGMVDIKLDFTPDNRVSPDPDAPPSLFDALPEQLGLRLQPDKGPVDSVIIDHIEKPSEN